MTKTINTDNIVGRYSIDSYCDFDKERSNIFFWLEMKNGKFPFSFIGRGKNSVSDSLKITKKEALNLLIEKYSDLLETLKDKRVKEALKRKIHYYKAKRGDFQASKKPKICRCCGQVFHSKQNFKYCSECQKISYWERYAMMRKRRLKNEL